MHNVKNIRFKGYKVFSNEQYAELENISKVNVIIGKNNSGKTSLLDIIEIIYDSKTKFSTTEEIQFDIPFNKDMINKIHKGALAFINDFSECFKEYIDEIDLNKYYMSIPLEYYYHYTNMEDRLPTKNLIFENNVNNYVELNDYIFQKYNNYSSEYSLGYIPKREINDIDYSLPKSRTKRVIYYLMFDRKAIMQKVFNNDK